MYIPAWPSLPPSMLVQRATDQVRPFPLDRELIRFFYLARYGIYHLFKELGLSANDVVLAPDYHHGNEILAMQAAGAKLRYYPVRRNLDLDLDAVASLCDDRTRVLYITHFIGWPQPMDDIAALCREKQLMLVEDCALAFLSRRGEVPLGSSGAYAIFCLYKTLPLPNGGVLVKNRVEEPGPDPASIHVHSPDRLSVTARSVELLLQWLRSHHERTGALLFDLKRIAGRTLSAATVERTAVGDSGFDISSANLGMAPLSESLLPRFDYESIVSRRRHNFRFLSQHLPDTARPVREDLEEGVCPLFFPLLVQEKSVAAAALAAQGIETVEFWNESVPSVGNAGSDARFLRQHVLEVPIHQELDDERLFHIAEQVRRLDLGLGASV